MLGMLYHYYPWKNSLTSQTVGSEMATRILIPPPGSWITNVVGVDQ